MLPYANEAKDDKQTFEYEAKEISWYDWLLLNRPFKVVLAFFILAVITPMLLYHYSFFSSADIAPADGFSTGSCLVSRTARLPCGVGNTSASNCHPQCCYDFDSQFCFHRYPSRFSYITLPEWAENTTLYPRIGTVPFNQNSLPELRISVDEITETHLSLTFYDPREITLEGRRLEEKNYTYEITNSEVNIVVNSTTGIIFNTARGPLIASNNIWEISFRLTDETMYGLGEIPLEEGTVKTLYSHNGGFDTVPLIFALSNGSYHGLLIDVKDPTEIRIRGAKQIVVRSITTSGLKFHMFVGPTPKDIMRDVMRLVGYENKLEYWMLGAHVCSEISSNQTSALDDLTSFLSEADTADLPYESHCGTSPIIFNDDQCDDGEDLTEPGANAVQETGKRFVPLISPYILYEYEIEEQNNTDHENVTDSNMKVRENCSLTSQFNEFLLHSPYVSNGVSNSSLMQPYKGLAYNRTVIYPDYEITNEEFIRSLWKYSLKVDGVILHNNWPLDESIKFHNETYNVLPYFSENFEAAFSHTPQWNITRSNGEMYLKLHNEYGSFFAQAFRDISGETPIWATSHRRPNIALNRQNIDTSWLNLRRELVQAALGGISGQWLWSTPICGDTENFNRTTHAPLCVKWYMAATYLPMIKIHSKSTRRDPLSFTGNNRAYILAALNQRLSLMPYFFTTLQEGPLLRPMFYQFPHHSTLANLTTQFSVGDHLLIVPNLQPSQSHVHVWMPPGSWYELWSGLPLNGEEGKAITMTTTEGDFLTLIRGGSVIVLQTNTRGSAEETRRLSEYSLKIALNCTTIVNGSSNNTICFANGFLYMAENTTLLFDANSYELRITLEGDATPFCSSSPSWAKYLTEMDIYGLEEELNNMDNYRHVNLTPPVDLCGLENSDRVVIQFHS